MASPTHLSTLDHNAYADWRRLAAFAVDGTIALLLCAVFRVFLPKVWWLGGLYLVVKDAAGLQSPGKRLFQLRVADVRGEGCRLSTAVCRNLTLLPPFLFVELLVTAFSHDRRRIGDVLAGTRVGCLPARSPRQTPTFGPAPAGN